MDARTPAERAKGTVALRSRNGHSSIPRFTIGGTNRLNAGRSHDFGGRSLNGVYITLGQAMGVDMTTFGDPQHAPEVLASPGVL